MKKITTKLKLLLAAVPLIGLALTAPASAWGPERSTFTMESPASYPTFNSITDNPTIGDERDFVRVGEINADVTDLKNEVEIVPGKQYLVYIYFHNDASATYNDAAHQNKGVAVQTKMSTTFPTVITAGEQGKVSAVITAENSNPASVWDEAYFTTKANKVVLNYVSGSAKIYNDWGLNGSVMPENLFSEGGTYLGINKLNGVILGCEEYHGVVSYVVEARELSGSVKKEVSLDGENYASSVEADPGAELYFRLTLKNTGGIVLTNATIKDSLPDGLSYVAGSTTLSANESTTKDPLSDDLTKNGFNLGTIGTGNTVYITYRATATSDVECDTRSMQNTATFTYDSNESSGDSSSSSATVIVKKDGCGPIPDDPNAPDDPGTPSELPNTGPAEIAMAAVIVLGIMGGGIYLWRTRHVVKTVEKRVSGSENRVDEKIVEKTEVEKSSENRVGNSEKHDNN